MAIVDDHPVVRQGTAAVLGQAPDIEVTKQGASLDEARKLISDQTVDVLLLDVRLAGESGFAALDRHAVGPAVIVLTAYDLPQYAEAAARLGAAGFVVKTAPLEDLLAAIRRVAAGGSYFSVRPGMAVSLTARELDVVRLVVDGRSNDEVGADLGIAPGTVETHLKHIFASTGVSSRTELVGRALREGWLDLPSSRERPKRPQ